MRTLLLCACLLRDANAFPFPAPPRRRPAALAARSKTSNNRWADRRSNYAIESSWRNPASPDVVYEIDRKVVVRHLPAGADAAYLRDVLGDAFGALASVEVAAGDVAYAVFEDPDDAATAARTSVRVRAGGGEERTIDCEAFEPRARAPSAAVDTVFVGNLPFDLGDDALARVFAGGGCGALAALRRPRPGIAYLRFADEAGAARAVRLAGTRVAGRALRVDWDDGDAGRRRDDGDGEPARRRDDSGAGDGPEPARREAAARGGGAARREAAAAARGGGAAARREAEAAAAREAPARRDGEPAPTGAQAASAASAAAPAAAAAPRAPGRAPERPEAPTSAPRRLSAAPTDAKDAPQKSLAPPAGPLVARAAARAAPAAPRRAPPPTPATRASAALAHARSASAAAAAAGGNGTAAGATRAAAASAAAAWREADALKAENAKLRARLPRRATWQPPPFEVSLGAGARPRDVVRARVDGSRDVEIVVPEAARPGDVLRVLGAVRVAVPSGAYAGSPLAVPLPDDGGAAGAPPARVVVAVPPGRPPGAHLYVAHPVEVVAPAPGLRRLPPPPTSTAVLAHLLPPACDADDPPRLAPPAAHQALVRAPPNDDDALAALADENDRLKRELSAMRNLLKTTSALLQESAGGAQEEGPDDGGPMRALPPPAGTG